MLPQNAAPHPAEVEVELQRADLLPKPRGRARPRRLLQPGLHRYPKLVHEEHPPRLLRERDHHLPVFVHQEVQPGFATRSLVAWPLHDSTSLFYCGAFSWALGYLFSKCGAWQGPKNKQRQIHIAPGCVVVECGLWWFKRPGCSGPFIALFGRVPTFESTLGGLPMRALVLGAMGRCRSNHDRQAMQARARAPGSGHRSRVHGLQERPPAFGCGALTEPGWAGSGGRRGPRLLAGTRHCVSAPPCPLGKAPASDTAAPRVQAGARGNRPARQVP